MSTDITLGGEAVGSVTFTQPDARFEANRTAWGFRIDIPAAVTFTPPTGSGAPLLLENLRATFSAADGGGQYLEIGASTYWHTLRTTARDQPISFSWDWTLAALAFYEQLRAGREPKFRVMVSGDIRYVLAGEPGREPCSVASLFHSSCEIAYSQKAWTEMLRQLNMEDAVLVEIPFAADPPSGWEPVWSALRDARDSFDAGGSTGWKNCVASVRHALEEWRQIEKEDQGPSDLKSRTKAQRIDALRWTFMQFAHFAPHTRADEWTRDDALLALSTLSALIAVRKP
jgi:hypothetical protein